MAAYMVMNYISCSNVELILCTHPLMYNCDTAKTGILTYIFKYDNYLCYAYQWQLLKKPYENQRIFSSSTFTYHFPSTIFLLLSFFFLFFLFFPFSLIF